MKKLLLTLALLGAFLIPGLAGAQGTPFGGGNGLEPRFFDNTGRTQVYPIFDANIYATATGSVTKAITQVGTRGLVMTTGAQAMTGVSHITQTSSLAALPYPADLRFAFFDSGGGNTITCAQAVVYGIDWRGIPVTETIRTLTEASPGRTTYTYQKITRLEVTGCNDFGASDQFQIYVGYRVGLPYRINRTTDIINICSQTRTTASNISHCVGPTSITGDTGTQDITISRSHPSANGVNIRDVGGNGIGNPGTNADHSMIWITYTGAAK